MSINKRQVKFLVVILVCISLMTPFYFSGNFYRNQVEPEALFSNPKSSDTYSVTVTDPAPYFTKGSYSGHPEYWETYVHNGHEYIWTYIGGMVGNPYQPDCWAEFRPYLPQAGRYEVYSIFYSDPQNSDDVPHTVYYDGGSTTISVSQYAPDFFTPTRYKLGEWDFAAGATTRVVISDANGIEYNGYTTLNADTIEFVLVTQPSGEPTITASLRVLQSTPYYVGDTITGEYTIKNKGSTPFTFEVLTIGGRDPDDQVADFTFQNWITLDPDQSYNYQGTLTLNKVGNYHFFCAYKTPDGSWNTAVPIDPGVTNINDIYVQQKINNAPLTPFNLYQLTADESTIILEGGTTNEDTVVFKATAVDPDDDDVRLEIELRQITAPFTGQPTPETISDYYPSGTTIRISRGWLIDADYHWQCRARDSNDAVSDWVEFGASGNIDFTLESLPPEPVITSSLMVQQYPPYYVGATITGQYTITNEGSSSITFEILTIGGRDPYDQVADFSNTYGVTLNPGQPYLYQGSITLNEMGVYHFFCAYKTISGDWNTGIPTIQGVSNVLDIYVESPLQEPAILQDLEISQTKPYYIGETVPGRFSIMNSASEPFTFEVLTIGGRDPDDQVADFTWTTDITLIPGQVYDYYGLITLTKSGTYHFFCAYKALGGDWNTAVPTFPGVSNVLDVQVDLELNEALRVGIYGVSDIDPHFIWDLQSTYIVQQVCEGLYTHDLSDLDLEIIPQLALDHGTWSGNNLEYTVQLRQGVTFHDGTTFDANAVKFSFDRLRNFMSGSGGSGITSPFESMYMFKGEPIINRIEILNPYTIKFVLNNPYAAFQGLLCFTGSYILSPSSTPFDYKLELAISDLIGTGPFVYDGFVGDDIKFHAFDNYWRGKANFDEMLFYIYSGSYDMSRALSSHKIHFINTPSFSFFYNFISDPQITLIDTIPSVIMQYLGMNNKLIDVDYRKAISYALDYDYIIETLMSNQAIRLRSPIPQGILYSDLSFNVPELDLPYARQIMQSMGFGVGYNLYQDDEWLDAAINHPFVTYNYTYNMESWFRTNMFYLLQDNLAKIGISVVEVPIIWDDMLKIMFELDGYTRDMLELFWMGWVPDFNDPSFINPLFTNDAVAANAGQVDDAQVQLWMEQALSETNPSIRENLYRNIQQRLIEEVYPCAWGYVPINYDAYLSDLKGFQSNPMNYVYFYPCYLESQIPRPSSLFDGMFMDYRAFGNLIEFTSASVSYTQLSEFTFHTTMSFDEFIGWYDVNKNNRIISNSGGAAYFMEGTHSFFWTYTDTQLGDYVPILIDGEGDHLFQVYGELSYNLDGFGTIEVWELEDLTEPGSYAWFEKSTGVLIKGEFYYGDGLGYYEVELVDSNADFEIFNHSPDLPSLILQLSQEDGELSLMGEGEIVTSDTVVFYGMLTDPDGDNVRLEIELRRIDEPFIGQPTTDTISEFVSSGEVVSIYRYGLNEGEYHWQYRVRDSKGSVSDWKEYGASENVDFTISHYIQFNFPEGWNEKELFLPYVHLKSLESNDFEIGVINKKDMWYVVKVFRRYDENEPWTEYFPETWSNQRWKNILVPYADLFFEYTPKVGEEIKILVSKHEDESIFSISNIKLGALIGFDLFCRLLLNKPLHEMTEIEPVVRTFLELQGGQFLYDLYVWIKERDEFSKGEFVNKLTEFYASNEAIIHQLLFGTTGGMAGVHISTLIATFAKRIFIAAQIIKGINLAKELFVNSISENLPITEEIILRSYKSSPRLMPEIKVVESLNIVDEPYHVIEAIKSYINLKNFGSEPITLKAIQVIGCDPFGNIIYFQSETGVEINPGETHSYQGLAKLLVSGEYHFYITYETYDHIWVTDIPTMEGKQNSLDIEVKGISWWRGWSIESPVEIRVEDSEGRITGLINGEIFTEIPNSFYFDETIMIYDPEESYKCILKGLATDTYNLTVLNYTTQEVLAFTAINIPTVPESIHQYNIDWTVLSQGNEGVELKVDSDGDGTIDNSFTSDNELSTAEFVIELMIWPNEGNALQDGVNFEIETSDDTIIEWIAVSIREPGGGNGLVISDEFEDLQLEYQGNNLWGMSEPFDTITLPDGYYVLVVQVSDILGFVNATCFSFSIRNWAVLELLPATQSNNPGRTMSVKFSLRVVEVVDPDMPFVVNEELCIVIYDVAKPSKILQTSHYGDSSKDYRIDHQGELYITNFKTSKVPATYVVEIWRGDMLIGSFSFVTQKKTSKPILVTQYLTGVSPNTLTLFSLLSLSLVGILTFRIKSKKKRD